jgi:hypothetical protein
MDPLLQATAEGLRQCRLVEIDRNKSKVQASLISNNDMQATVNNVLPEPCRKTTLPRVSPETGGLLSVFKGFMFCASMQVENANDRRTEGRISAGRNKDRPKRMETAALPLSLCC